jgi:hypothetical protein
LDDKEQKTALSKLFDVQGIPTMVLLRKNEHGRYELENADLRSKIETDPENFPWPPKALESLDSAVEAINDYPTLVAFTDKFTDAAAADAVTAAMNEVAAEYFANGKPSEAIRFAIAGEEDDSTDQVRQFVGAHKDKDGPTSLRITLVDVQKQGKVDFWGPEKAAMPSAADIRQLISGYLGGSIDVKPFS